MLDDPQPLEIGKGRIVKQGTAVAILSYGARMQECLRAADMLDKQGLSTTVADARFAKPLDEALIAQLAKNHEVLITIEEGARGRATLAEELRSTAERLAARPDGTGDDALRMHQRSVEALLARLIEDSARNRNLLVEELRGEFRLLARTIVAPAQRDGQPPSPGEG